MADAIFAVQGLGSFPVLAFGGVEQRDALRAGVVSGRAHRRVRAHRARGGDRRRLVADAGGADDGDGWTLQGHKTLISNVGIAGHYVVFANVDPSLGRKGITAFLVDAGARGLSERPLHLSSRTRSGSWCSTAASCRLGARRRARSGVRDRHGYPRRLPHLGGRGRQRDGRPGAGVGPRAGQGTATVRASPWPSSSRSRPTWPTWRPSSTPRASWWLAPRVAARRARERVTSEAAMAKMFATEAAQRIIDRPCSCTAARESCSAPTSRRSTATSAPCASTRARPRSSASSSPAACSGSSGARRLGGARAWRGRGGQNGGASAKVAELWPQFGGFGRAREGLAGSGRPERGSLGEGGGVMAAVRGLREGSRGLGGVGAARTGEPRRRWRSYGRSSGASGGLARAWRGRGGQNGGASAKVVELWPRFGGFGRAREGLAGSGRPERGSLSEGGGVMAAATRRGEGLAGSGRPERGSLSEGGGVMAAANRRPSS
jgi:hypothetical protein